MIKKEEKQKKVTDYVFKQSGEQINKPKEQICKHKNLTPIEIDFARRHYPNGHREPAEYEYNVTALGATTLHVTKYFCINCKKIIKAPKVYEE